MRRIFIIQNTSAFQRRSLYKINSSKNNSAEGFLVAVQDYSLRLHRFKKEKIIKFEFFSDALNFINFEKELNNVD